MRHHGFTYEIILILLSIGLIAANLLIGSVHIPAGAVWDILCGNEVEKASWTFIVRESRFPQTLTALLCGAALSASGLMLQTVFNNPLADSSILGISSGSSVGVALVMLAGGGSIAAGTFTLSGFVTVMLGAFAGAIAVMGLILFLSTLIRNSIMLLIAGIMIGYIASSLISLLNFFATEEGVHSFMIWGLGNFGGVSLSQLPAFSLLTLTGLAMSVLLIKPLNALLLGPRYAENLGINIRRIRNLLLLATGLLTAVTTSFCGPVSFIGLAVPHLARLLLGTSNHNRLMPVTLLTGAALALLCNLLCILPILSLVSGGGIAETYAFVAEAVTDAPSVIFFHAFRISANSELSAANSFFAPSEYTATLFACGIISKTSSMATSFCFFCI